MRLAVIDDYGSVAAHSADWSALSGRVEIDFFSDHLTDNDELAERLEPYDIICITRERTPFPASLLGRLPRLKHLFTSGRRNASIDLRFAAERGILVTGSPTLSFPTVELTFGLMLALCRNIVDENLSVSIGGWQTMSGQCLNGRTLGILGLGRLGTSVANIANAFGMRVIAWSRSLTPERAGEAGVSYRPYEALLAESDIISIHLKLNDGTRGMISDQAFDLMKPTARLINTSRGPIVDDDALIRALNQNKIAGAALDVFSEEPLPLDHPLRDAQNLLMTPHLGYSVEENYRVFFSQAVENIAAWLDGETINALT